MAETGKSIRSTANSYRDVVRHYVMGNEDANGNPTVTKKDIDQLTEKLNAMEEMMSIISKDAITDATDQDAFGNAFSNADVSVVKVAAGTYSAPVEAVTKSMMVNGAQQGVSASSGDRCTDETAETETVISGAMNFGEGATAIVDGVTLTPNAPVTISGSADLTMRNSRIVDREPDAAKSFIIKSTSFDNKIKLNISGMYFGNNPTNETGNVYNGLELQATLQDGSVIENCYFAKDCLTHNHINIYGVEDGATIYIRNNHFECSKNAIRIGIVGEPTCTIVMEGNSYDETDSDPAWAGLLLIQPYNTRTTSFKNLTVIMNNTTHPDDGQLYYLYAQPTDMQFTEDNVPTIIIDGVTQEELIISS